MLRDDTPIFFRGEPCGFSMDLCRFVLTAFSGLAGRWISLSKYSINLFFTHFSTNYPNIYHETIYTNICYFILFGAGFAGFDDGYAG